MNQPHLPTVTWDCMQAPSDLDDAVHRCVALGLDPIPVGSTLHRIPDGLCYLFASDTTLQGRPGIYLAGLKTKIGSPIPVTTDAVALAIYPHVLARLVGGDVGKLVDQRIDMGQVWGAEGHDLIERLVALRGTAAKVELFTAFVRRRLELHRHHEVAADRLVSAAIAMISEQLTMGHVAADESCEDSEGPSVVDLAARLGVSPRHLHRSFIATSGLTPSAYVRIRRFRRAVQHLLRRGSPESLDRLSITCGYADQAHFTRACTGSISISPARLLRGLRSGLYEIDDGMLVRHGPKTEHYDPTIIR